MHVCGARGNGQAVPEHAPGAQPSGRWRIARLLLLLTALGSLPLPAAEPPADAAAPFRLPTASVRLVDDVYRLDAVASLRLTPDIEDALRNGVDLTLTWEVSIERSRAWWLDAEVAYIAQRYRLSFHGLTRQYVVTNLNTGESRSYTRAQTALDQVGTLVGFPLVDRVLVQDGERLVGHVRIRLQHDQLPLPLRAVALFDDDWDLASEWYQWRFE